ncbi:MAG: VacJ family lipoprotein [Thermodesulfobacteriota bacterium]
MRLSHCCLGLALFCLLGLAGIPSGLAATEAEPEAGADLDEETTAVEADPLAGWNRAMYTFNDRLYFWVLKPVAQGYGAVLPEGIRVSIRDFFRHLATPIRFLNCCLQGKVNEAGREVGRLMLNTTFGLAGFIDFAGRYEDLPASDEDFGQTLGAWGVGEGVFITWPVLGPCTLRDTFGLAGDALAYPPTYVSPALASVGIRTGEKVNDTSLTIGDYEALKDAALEPYTAVRDAYLQHRRDRVAQ